MGFIDFFSPHEPGRWEEVWSLAPGKQLCPHSWIGLELTKALNWQLNKTFIPSCSLFLSCWPSKRMQGGLAWHIPRIWRKHSQLGAAWRVTNKLKRSVHVPRFCVGQCIQMLLSGEDQMSSLLHCQVGSDETGRETFSTSSKYRPFGCSGLSFCRRRLAALATCSVVWMGQLSKH